jgi:uncharacterized protein
MAQSNNHHTPSEDQDTGIAVLCHLATFSMYIGVPFGNILGPLVVWLLGRTRSVFVDHQGKEALNFQISFMVYILVLGVLGAAAFVTIFIDGRLGIAGIAILVLLGILLGVLHFVLVIVAAVQAGRGKWYRYPLTFRLIR